MQIQLENNRWKISYTDSNGEPQHFFHPLETRDLVYYRESNGILRMKKWTEELLRANFTSDGDIEQMIAYMKANGSVFEPGVDPWA